MTDLSSIQQDLSALGVSTTADAKPTQTDPTQKADFLLLMTEQIKHQNPLNPLEGKDFLAQLAQFSVVEELTKLNTGFTSLSQSMSGNQSLQAAGLLGKTARVASSGAYFTASQPISGSANLPLPAANVQVNYYDQVGTLAHSETLGAQNAGDLQFTWNGFDAQGVQQPDGYYRVEVLADMGTGSQAMSTHMDAKIESVSVGGGSGLQLDLQGVGTVPFSSIQKLSAAN